MAKEAERLLDDSGWLPEPLRTQGHDDPIAAHMATLVRDAGSAADAADAAEISACAAVVVAVSVAVAVAPGLCIHAPRPSPDTANTTLPPRPAQAQRGQSAQVRRWRAVWPG